MARHFLETGLVIHCEAHDGSGYTLCGAALEGTYGDQEMTETHANINCERCIAIIDHCRKVRPGEVCSPFQRRTRS